jgi:hypothetical protein
MHVKKRDAITFSKRLTFNIEERTANLAQTANRDMTRNEWIRNSFEKSSLQINIRTAHLGKFDIKQRGVFFELGLRNFAELNW